MATKLFHKVQPTAPEDRVPPAKRVAYGMGNFSDHIGTDTLMSNANPIFNIALHMDPRLLGVAIAIMRLWDAITDPVVGAISDNTRTRWGRRRPLMFLGAISAALTFPLIWLVPGGLGSTGLFIWFTAFSILFFTCQTLFAIPYMALGYELTPDYNERTRVMELRAYLGTAALLVVPWSFAFTQLPVWGGSTLTGARWMGICAGVIIVLSGLIPVIFLRERFFKSAQKQAKIPILKSVGMTLKNRPFLLMVGITFFTVVGGRTVNHLGFYIGLYYLFDGDTVKQGILAGINGNVALVVGLLSVFLLNRLSQRIGKRKTLVICLLLLVVSGLAKWLFYRPESPWLSLWVNLFTVPASSGFWLLIASIKADICDDDELNTGFRREGAIGSVSAWISKLSTSATAVLAGFVLAVTGYQAASGSAQAAGVIDAMRWWFYFIPSISAIIALILLWWFPITEERARETRRLLEERRGKL
ncbi:MFS transporter [Geminisphaera colitermitum]|uniref:MFS transporter n=1 Tax=Geminisphaera colitermitum TaxID=1148786 RepID=UPI000158C954|nr:MFS transporter [Geminisphaera colitermitum]